jgi:hypothetical protein
MARMNLFRQVRGTLNLNGLSIVSIGFFIPLRLAFPLAVQIVLSRRTNTV